MDQVVAVEGASDKVGRKEEEMLGHTSKDWTISRTLGGIRQYSVQGISMWLEQRIGLQGTGRVVFREEIGEGDSDLGLKLVPRHAEQFAHWK